MAMVRQLPLKSSRYKLWHDADMSYRGRRLHVKLAPPKDVTSALRKALNYFDEYEDLSDVAHVFAQIFAQNIENTFWEFTLTYTDDMVGTISRC